LNEGATGVDFRLVAFVGIFPAGAGVTFSNLFIIRRFCQQVKPWQSILENGMLCQPDTCFVEFLRVSSVLFYDPLTSLH
jgi:hypothetical protein